MDMAYRSTAYRQQPRYRRHRRRRRNSHYGVLVVLILLIVIAVPVTIFSVRKLTGAIFGSTADQIVYQIDNPKAYADEKIIDLGNAAPYKEDNGVVMTSAQSLSDHFDLGFEWEQVSKTATFTHKKNTLRVQAGSTSLRLNDTTSTMEAAPEVVDNTVYVPVRDLCKALEWQESELPQDQGNFVIVTRSKKALNDKKLGQISEEALEALGPALPQVEDGLIMMKVDSDKMIVDGKSVQMSRDGQNVSVSVIEKDGMRYVPLKPAIEALEGTAEYDGKRYWNINCMNVESTVDDEGKTKVNGKRVKGDDITAYSDGETFFVSVPLLAAVLGKNYNDLGDGSMALTNMPLDGYDSQKAYLSTMEDGLTQAAPVVNVPEADVYVALTFDDGPTGAIEDIHPGGFTAELLEELGKRNVHATFFMCGYRIKDFNGHMKKYLEGGHELGNHTMDHPDEHLTGLDAERIHDQVESNSELIEEYTGQKPTVMRPVGGGVNDDVKEQMKELGLPIINWSVDTLDWKTRTDPDSVKNHILDEVEDGSIVLMHDMYEGTFQGVLAAIDELQSRKDKTYAFVTVSELAAIHGITLEPGMVYSDLSKSTAQAIADGSYTENIFP